VDFDPVWVSTIQHVDAYGSIVSNNSLLGDCLGSYRIPEGFPYRAVSSRGGNAIIPLMMFATGRLHVDFATIEYNAQAEYRSLALTSVTDFNLRTHFDFRLPWTDVIAIERYDPPRFEDFAGNEYFPVWARLQTRQPGELCDFLLSIGGRSISTMRGVTERAEELCGMLQRRLSLIRTAEAQKKGN
jgi:hypothetical protein